MIRELWISDEIILPQHIICEIMKQKNYMIKAGKLKKYIERFISENNLVVSYSNKQI
jgi:3,4-dihydroxy-2-butanone 4-phosphate synthase